MAKYQKVMRLVKDQSNEENYVTLMIFWDIVDTIVTHNNISDHIYWQTDYV